jgi:hypothetical protein
LVPGSFFDKLICPIERRITWKMHPTDPSAIPASTQETRPSKESRCTGRCLRRALRAQKAWPPQEGWQAKAGQAATPCVTVHATRQALQNHHRQPEETYYILKELSTFYKVAIGVYIYSLVLPAFDHAHQESLTLQRIEENRKKAKDEIPDTDDVPRRTHF